MEQAMKVGREMPVTASVCSLRVDPKSALEQQQKLL